MSKTIEILETKTLGEWTCTRPTETYHEREIPNIMKYIDSDYFYTCLNEHGVGKVEITIDTLEDFMNDVEFNTSINWTEDDIKFIKTVKENLQNETFVKIEIW